LAHWHRYANWAKQRPITRHVVDRLGRGRGRLRPIGGFRPATPSRLKPDLANWQKYDLAAAWVGHATVLLRLGGMTIITDPVMASRVGLGLGVVTGGPRRLVAPALSIAELPPLDLILLSHAHFDHLDRPTLVRLPKRTPVVTAHHTQDLVRDLGFRNVTELRWGDATRVGPVDLVAHPVNHWGARTIFDRHRGFNAYSLRDRSTGRSVLYGGDTAYHTGFQGIPPVDLAILGIGGYDPYIHAHANPEQAWEMTGHLRADFLLPMHHSTFRLSKEPVGEPLERLLAAAGREAERVVVREVGGLWAHGG
jgi:L-ascorbate metabolism protein UlaG (beta-lactamase superfamily)